MLRPGLWQTAAVRPAAALFVISLLVATTAEAKAKTWGRGDPFRLVLLPRFHLAGGGAALLMASERARLHVDVVADITLIPFGPPRAKLAPSDRNIRPFARIQGRVALTPDPVTVELDLGLQALVEQSVAGPLLPDFSSPVGKFDASLRIDGGVAEGVRLEVMVAGSQQGASDRAGTPARGRLGGSLQATLAKFEGGASGMFQRGGFVADDVEGPIQTRLFADEVIGRNDPHPLGGAMVEATFDLSAGWLEGLLWRPTDDGPPVVPSLRIEGMATLPLPAPWPRALWPALEAHGVAGAVLVAAPGHLDLPYPGALTRDPRQTRGETLLLLGGALRTPIAPPWTPAPGFLAIGAPLLQIDLTLGDTWGYGPSVDLRTGTRRLPGPTGGDTAPIAGELGIELRLPMFWGPVYWTGAARFEVGLRSGDGVLPALDRALPWSADGERPPLGFSLGIGVPIR